MGKEAKMGHKKVQSYARCGGCGRSGPQVQDGLAYVLGRTRSLKGKLRCAECRKG